MKLNERVHHKINRQRSTEHCKKCATKGNNVQQPCGFSYVDVRLRHWFHNTWTKCSLLFTIPELQAAVVANALGVNNSQQPTNSGDSNWRRHWQAMARLLVFFIKAFNNSSSSDFISSQELVHTMCNLSSGPSLGLDSRIVAASP